MRNVSSSGDQSPAWLGHAAFLLFIGTLVGTGILVILLLLGAADPKPLGSLIVDDTLDSVEGWDIPSERANAEVQDGTYRITLSDPETSAYITSPYQVDLPGTIEVSAQQLGGSPAAGYGIWWGEGAQVKHRGFMVNGNSYVAVFDVIENTTHFARPWERFPWVLPLGQINRLRVDLEEAQVTLRLNEEVVGIFQWDSGPTLRVGLIVETFDEGDAVIAFEGLRIWQAAPQ